MHQEDTWRVMQRKLRWSDAKGTSLSIVGLTVDYITFTLWTARSITAASVQPFNASLKIVGTPSDIQPE